MREDTKNSSMNFQSKKKAMKSKIFPELRFENEITVVMTNAYCGTTSTKTIVTLMHEKIGNKDQMLR